MNDDYLYKPDDDFSIDRFHLELEQERNSHMIRKYGKLLAKACGLTREAKRRLNVIQAQQAELIRTNYKSYLISKVPSDKVAFALAEGEPEYINQFKIYSLCLEREDDYRSAVDSCKQRGMMLKLLNENWHGKYYTQMPGEKSIFSFEGRHIILAETKDKLRGIKYKLKSKNKDADEDPFMEEFNKQFGDINW